MSRLSKLLGKPQDFEIGGEVLTIHPLSLEDIDLVFELERENTRAEAMKKIMMKTLKRAVPDSSNEEIGKVAVSHFKALTDAIMQVNGIAAPQELEKK
jgi:hypothetical protein